MKVPKLHYTASALTAVLLTALNIHAGSVIRFFFDGDSTASSPTSIRQSVATLTNDVAFPDSPDFREQLDDFFAIAGYPLSAGLQGKDNSGSDYGSWIRGYLEAPTTGQYLFGLASGDNSELYLSTDHLPANAQRIAYEPGTGEALFSGNRLDTRVSAPVSLVQGQKYYFEVRHQHGGGVGYIEVGWQRPDGVQEIIPALHLAQYEIDPFLFTDYSGQPPVFNAPAPSNRGGYNGGDITNNVVLNESDELLLPLDIISPQPTTFVWTTNGVAVAGQNLSYFDLPHTAATYNGVKIQAIVSNAYGSLTSSVSSVSVSADITRPTIQTVDTAGDPNLVEVAFSKPVDPATGTNVSNYQVSTVGGSILPITGATLSSDQQTVTLLGTFNFQTGSNYLLTAQGIQDQSSSPNTLSPNPSVVPFILSAPLGKTYNFDLGAPSELRFFGNAGITNSTLAASGSGILRLTDAGRNFNGAALITTRQDVDQVHIKFQTRISDAGATVQTDQPWGDGFSVNVSANLPLGTFNSPQFGYSPTTPGQQFTVYFNSHGDDGLNPAEIGVSLNSQVLTNVFAGTNGVPLNGIPSIVSTDGHWAPVDINLHRDGTLDISFDNVVILTNYQTPWLGISSAEIGFAAATRGWFETHWIDNLYINFGEGDIGNVGLSANSILGGTFLENSIVTLVAAPTGAGPFVYQWYKDGAPVVGATARILSFQGQAGTGGEYYLAVSNSFSSLISTTNAVIIQPDLVPPSVLSARGIAGGVNEVLLTFNKPLDPSTATAPSTYSSPFLVIGSASVSEDGRTVILSTTQQRVGTRYPLYISGLKDTTAAGNVLTTNLTFSSGLTYRDEILADRPVRYFKLDETNGTVAFTQTVSGDNANTNGEYRNLPILGVSPLVPSAGSNEFAVKFVPGNTNWVFVPNGGDVNDFRGPWAKRSYELWFNASSFPSGTNAGDTAVQAQTHSIRGLWEEGGNLRDIGLYLWNNTGEVNPATALLTFHAYNSTSDGPGSPFGLLNHPATYITYPVTTNVTYHVVAVFDGDPVGTSGGLRLYVNSQLVSQLTNGVGQIYNHNGDVEIGQGNGRSHLNVNGVWGAFDGVIDEVSVYNSVLSTNRIASHYQAGIGSSTAPTIEPVLIDGVDPRGNPNRLDVIFNEPISAQTATNLANYSLQAQAGPTISISSAQLANDLKTVILSGSFNFQVGSVYHLAVQGVEDILASTNVAAATNLGFTFSSSGPVGIAPASSLGNQVVTENQPVTWTAIPNGQPPFSYQWLSNTVALVGQTNATLSFAAGWNSGASYSVAIANEFSAITSSPPAVLTVLPDVAPPQLTGVHALAGTLNRIVLAFSEPVDPQSATNLSTYNVPTSQVTSLALMGASLSSDGLQVILTTTPQVHGQTNQLTIANLKDRAHVPNSLSVSVSFVSGISFRDEVLSEGAVRYWTFDETNGTDFHSLVSKFDTDPLNILGNIVGTPTLGVPGLVPNVANNTAISFSKLSTNNHVELPNAKDINAILGPWAKITQLFSFRANSLPRVIGASNYIEAPALYGHGAIAFYLYGTQDTNQPTQALLVFKANNTSSDGPGAPWGGNTLANAKYITYPIQAGQVYNVVGVLDGNASFTGALRLYVNGVLVGSVTGVGEIYKHPNTPPSFGMSYFSTHEGTNYTIRPDLVTATTFWADRFDGVIDEAALINSVLPASRIAQLYTFANTNAVPPSFSVVSTNDTGPLPTIGLLSLDANRISVSWPTDSGGYSLEFTTNLASGLWLPVSDVPLSTNGLNIITQDAAVGTRFFRLRKP